jgi:hypothetical protein
LLRRLGAVQFATFREESKQIIKVAWKREVRAYYRGLQQPRKLIRLGASRLVLAAPGPDVDIMERAMVEWQRMQAELDAAYAQPEAQPEASSSSDEASSERVSQGLA